jgi:hypothetical protein
MGGHATVISSTTCYICFHPIHDVASFTSKRQPVVSIEPHCQAYQPLLQCSFLPCHLENCVSADVQMSEEALTCSTVTASLDNCTAWKKGMISSCQKMPLYSFFRFVNGLLALLCQM